MISVLHIGGNVATNHNGITSDAWTSTPGSTIAVIGQVYDQSGVPASPAASDCQDNLGNIYTLAPNADLYSGTNNPGIALFYKIGGTRGAGHTVTFQTASADQFDNVAVIEFASDLGAMSFDLTTAHAIHQTSGGSPWNVTAAGAILGSQIALYGLVIDTALNQAFTQPGGYTNIINQPDGTTELVTDAAYKIGETGTPTVGASSGHVLGSFNGLIGTFKEAVATSGQVLVPPNWPRVT